MGDPAHIMIRRRAVRLALGAIVLTAVAGPAPVDAQALHVGDAEEAYLRVLQLSGVGGDPSFTVRPLSLGPADSILGQAAHPWADRGPVGVWSTTGRLDWSVGDSRIRSFLNSRHPRGGNDGAIWQGKGLTTSTETTARVRLGGLSVTVNPLVIYTQNAAFPLAPVGVSGLSEYAYAWHRMDMPQRFGDESFWTFDLGQSRIAYDLGAARFSVGNENLWWGPGIRNAIVMSSNAPGFRHASLSTARPVDLGIGLFEGQWIWGGLGQSDYFDDPTLESSDRFITGIVLTYRPSFVEGLALGATRVFQTLVPESGLDAGEYLLVFQGLLKSSQVSGSSPQGNDDRDQLLSLFARWAFPSAGFEAYVEWARNDHSGDLQDLLLEPEHSQAYTLGFQHVTSFSPDRAWVVRGELTHLEAPPTFQLRPRGVYYTHSVVRQGYTHEGQVLGAWIGPGGNGQYLGVDVYDVRGSASLFVQRQVHDNDAFWVWAAANGEGYDHHDVSIDIGLRGLYFLGDFDVGAGVAYTREINRYFVSDKVNNVNLSLGVRWRPRAR